MFDKFGEFDSVEELNRTAAELKAAGDEKRLVALAEENGIDKEDAEDYMDGAVLELANASMAAIGKLKTEAAALEIRGILLDWKEGIETECINDEHMARAVRKKDRHMRDCMASMLRYAFENKEQVSEEIVKVTRVTHNGKEEPMRGPVYLGVPDRAHVRKLARKYYLGGDNS